MTLRKCKECGVEFEPVRSTQVYHAKACQKKAYDQSPEGKAAERHYEKCTRGMRLSRRRAYLEASGWTVGRPQEAHLLNVLAACGLPLSCPQCARAMRLSRRRTGDYLAALIARGLVVGMGRRPILYILSPLSLSILEERREKEAIRND